jgi:uncharacterized protein
MKLAILSDIHDHVWNLRAALEACREADALICCGDLCSPFIVKQLADGFAGPIHIVFGNNDGDQFRITQNAAAYGGRVKIHGEFADLPESEFGLRIAVNHYPQIADRIAASGLYDVVCHGHDHRFRQDVAPNGTLILNPGAVMGYDPATATDIPATLVILDTEERAVNALQIGVAEGEQEWPARRDDASPDQEARTG